jgi:hypothetical protein
MAQFSCMFGLAPVEPNQHGRMNPSRYRSSAGERNWELGVGVRGKRLGVRMWEGETHGCGGAVRRRVAEETGSWG